MSPDQLTAEPTELLRTMIRNACVNDDTVGSGQEIRNVAALEDYFAGSGLTCERHEAAPGRASLIARIEGRDRTAPTLLLMGHTDVVPANPAGWRRDPFGGDLVDDIVWGRGARRRGCAPSAGRRRSAAPPRPPSRAHCRSGTVESRAPACRAPRSGASSRPSRRP